MRTLSGRARTLTVTPLLKANAAAELLAVSPRKLWELTNRGDVPCVRIGWAVRYDADDLRAGIEGRKGGRR